MELIASADNNWGIGKDGGLLFTIPEDMRRFKQLTMGQIVVMGRATCLSLPHQRPLPGRENIVLSRDESFAPEGFTVVRSRDELLAWLAEHGSGRRVMVMGGASLYEQLLPDCDTAHITRFFAEFPADRFLPELDNDPAWRLAATSATYTAKGVAYDFRTYKRR